MTTRPSNRLAQATSPYLLQHAHNPVDWYPWGLEALEKAKREDKPIFLSVGYAACHWCHVMERESFEDEEVAKRLNEDFVAIKVDREERPDIDAVYMTATVAMSGSGGWPMSVFMTPEGRPFFAGTYFPKSSKYGRPGFLDVLRRIKELWGSERGELLEQANELVSAIETEAAAEAPRPIDGRAEQMAAEQLMKSFDHEWGGFGGAPKFPAPASISLLLRQFRATQNQRFLGAALTTLDRMARGGMYDHVGGGFARYSTDEKWHVPHFEKMLYDNAQLVRAYVEAWQVTKNESLRGVAIETLDYVIREMQGQHGGYFSATDADSEGEEGKFFVWSKEEIETLLTEDEAAAVINAFDVRARGNWEGHNVLWIPIPLDDVAKELGIRRVELDARIASAKKTLYEARAKRVPPLLDDKVLVSWNGLMIGAMAFAARALGEPRFLESAKRAAKMIETMMTKDGELLRTFRADKAHIPAFLEDYAFLADALVDLYEASGDRASLGWATRLVEHAVSTFRAPDGDGFCTTSSRHEALVVRMRDGTDNATPSANAVLARALARLSAHLGRDDLRKLAEGAARAHGRSIARMPRAFATTLDAVSRLVEPPVEVALVGAPSDEAYRKLDAALGRVFLPSVVIARLDPTAAAGAAHPLLEGKTLVDGKPAAYVCRAFSCLAPVTSPEALSKELEEASARSRGDRATSLDLPQLGQPATRAATEAFAKRGIVDDGSGPLKTGQLLDWVVNRLGVLVASYRENEASVVVEQALADRRNLIVFDAQRASAVGDAIEAAVRGGIVTRDAIVAVGILSAATPWPDVVAAARSLAADARVDRLDLLLVPFTESASEEIAETIAHLANASVAVHLGVAVAEPIDSERWATLSKKIPDAARVVAAPFSVLEGDLQVPSAVFASKRAFLALRALDPKIHGHIVQIADATAPGDLPEAPAFAAALAALAGLEDEYKKTIAVHIRVQGEVDIDPNDLLSWSEELGRAEKAIDDLLEVEAFVAQSVSPALRMQFGALSSIQGELAPRVESLRERYLEALDRALKALARRVVARQVAATQALGKALGVMERTSLAHVASGAVLDTPGVAAAIVTCRTSSHVGATSRTSAAPSDAAEKARISLGAKKSPV